MNIVPEDKIHKKKTIQNKLLYTDQKARKASRDFFPYQIYCSIFPSQLHVGNTLVPKY